MEFADVCHGCIMGVRQKEEPRLDARFWLNNWVNEGANFRRRLEEKQI